MTKQALESFERRFGKTGSENVGFYIRWNYITQSIQIQFRKT